MSYASGDIVTVDIPFAEGATAKGQVLQKTRPALLVAGPDAMGDFIALMVTGQSHHANSVAIQPADLAQGHMTKPSWVRADRIHTVSPGTFVSRNGRAKPDLLARVRKLLCPTVGCK